MPHLSELFIKSTSGRTQVFPAAQFVIEDGLDDTFFGTHTISSEDEDLAFVFKLSDSCHDSWPACFEGVHWHASSIGKSFQQVKDVLGIIDDVVRLVAPQLDQSFVNDIDSLVRVESVEQFFIEGHIGMLG